MAYGQENTFFSGQKPYRPQCIIYGFFDSRQQQYEVIIPYILEDLQGNDKVINILQADRHGEHCRCLAENGISLTEKLASGQFEVLASENTYIKDGVFGAERIYKMLEKTLESASRTGYDSLRACGDMLWALKDLPGTQELLEYGTSLNVFTPKHSCSIICMYDISSFSESFIEDVLGTHPYVLCNGKVSPNPEYSAL